MVFAGVASSGLFPLFRKLNLLNNPVALMFVGCVEVVVIFVDILVVPVVKFFGA